MTHRKTIKAATAGNIPVDKEEAEKARAAQLASVGMSPSVRNSMVAQRYSREFFSHTEVPLADCLHEMVGTIRGVRAGNLASVVATLVAQANALDAMFANLSMRALNQDHLPAMQVFTALALKAQSQCRSTLEALAEIKNPRPVAFVKQANIANGPQQVNNGTPMQADGTPARAGKTETEPNKLLEADHDARMDTRAPGAAIGSDTEMAAVGSIQRPDKRRRQG